MVKFLQVKPIYYYQRKPFMNKPELLAPAGDFEKLQMAVAYGADAVYLGGKQFSLRANAKNFDMAELHQAITYAHNSNVKVYVSVNIFAHNQDFTGLKDYLLALKDMGVDAVIVADLGVFDIARQIDGLDIHISTQANITNFHSAKLYRELGARRAILARELSIGEISEINKQLAASETKRHLLHSTDTDASTHTHEICAPFETEVFIHGAMCVSYSGRCLLSNYMANRDANKGDCAQPCRWKYHLMEDKRPGEYIPVYEDERGTYIMNSKDLCMINHIPELIAAGISSFKIEGRMKTAYYVAAVTRAYREAIDDYFTCESLYASKKDYYLHELEKTSHRDFFTGFYLGIPADGQNLTDIVHGNVQDFLGVVVDYDADSQLALVEQRNKFTIGDEFEFLKSRFKQAITEIYDEKGNPISSAPHPMQLVRIRTLQPVERFDILRRL